MARNIDLDAIRKRNQKVSNNQDLSDRTHMLCCVLLCLVYVDIPHDMIDVPNQNEIFYVLILMQYAIYSVIIWKVWKRISKKRLKCFDPPAMITAIQNHVSNMATTHFWAKANPVPQAQRPMHSNTMKKDANWTIQRHVCIPGWYLCRNHWRTEICHVISQR